MGPSNIQPKPARALASLSLMPSNIKYANQNADEKIVLFIRQHKIILFGYVVLFLFRLILPLFIYLLISWILNLQFVRSLGIDIHIKDSYIMAALLIWYLFSFTRFFADFLYWFFNGYIVTSQRLLDLDFLGVLKHSVKELDLRSIEDAVDVHDGILQTVFDMGNVIISTASESTRFTLDNVPKSSNVRDFIMDLSIYNRK